MDTGPAVIEYMGFQEAVAEKTPELLPIAMLPCTILWPWIAGGLVQRHEVEMPERNPYVKDWFEPNMREPGKISSTEKFVDDHFKKDDEQGTLAKIFCKGMMNEVNFFREACGEELLMNVDEICRGRRID